MALDIKREISLIKERNKRVESDKAWETSRVRKLIIASMTYFVIVVFLYMIDAPDPWIAALVPTIGYILSTLTLPLFKKMWINNFYKK